MANPEHVAIVTEGAEAIRKWRRKWPRKRLDLKQAELANADLFGANLKGANLTGASLFEANLATADLTDCKLKGAILGWADMEFANLTGADLERAELFYANLGNAWLDGTNLAGAGFGGTKIADCELHWCVGLETAVHELPSSIGVDTLVKSFRSAGDRLSPGLETFFRNAGVPQELLAALPQIMAKVKYCMSFICYGEPDRDFAEKLYADLKARGVSCWLYSMDATPGERTWREIGRKRREADKMIVLCSAPALVRDGVLKEIEGQIDEDPGKMVPVSLDDLWKAEGFKVMRGEWNLKQFLIQRNYVDFTDDSKYEQSLTRLLEGLKREDR